MIELRKPIWNGGKPHIGVADFRIGSQGNCQVKIRYVRKSDGEESYPGWYEMDCNKLRKYPVQVVGGGVKLHVAPLEDWEHKGV